MSDQFFQYIQILEERANSLREEKNELWQEYNQYRSRVADSSQHDRIHSDNIDKLAEDLSKAQYLIRNVIKNKSAYSHKYADLPSCLDEIKEAFYQNGFAIPQSITKDYRRDGRDVLVTMLMHKSGQWMKSVCDIHSVSSKSTNDMQAFGSGITYARRYSLAALAGIASEDEDDDGKASGPLSHHQTSRNVITMKVATTKSEDKTAILMKELRDLCENNDVDFSGFGVFHKLSRKDESSLKNAIDGFDDYLNRYRSSKGAMNEV